jgi:5-methylcytosine-specific restriction endonuclease McrA
VPAWVGLLALLEDFVLTWDPEKRGADTGIPKRPGDPVYARSGWRCAAPGCTSRKNLDDHHVVYRSRRGSDALANRACLCRFHHQRGEHGELASCRGKAPLGILWRLGRKELAVWYCNERRVVPESASGAGGSPQNGLTVDRPPR